MDQLINIVAADSCPILNLFIDWNPIYTEKYTGGYPNETDSSLYYRAAEDEPSIWATLVEKAKKLQVLFLRHSNLNDTDLKAIFNLLKPEAGNSQNKSIRVLDISYNNFTS
jgi:hypothetical protein